MSLRDKGQWADFCWDDFGCDDAAVTVNYSYPINYRNDSTDVQHYVIMTDYDKPNFETTTEPVNTCGSDFEVNRINLLSFFIALFFL